VSFHRNGRRAERAGAGRRQRRTFGFPGDPFFGYLIAWLAVIIGVIENTAADCGVYTGGGVSELIKKFVVFSVLLSFLAGGVLMAAGCGPSADQIAKNAIRADDKIKTAHAVYSTKQQLPLQPIKEGKLEKNVYTTNSEGDFDQRTGDWQVKGELASGIVATGLWVDDKYYMELGGIWYEMPNSMYPAAPATKTLSISQYLKYFKSLNKMGDVKIDGEACYHLQGIPSMKDLIKLPGITDLLKDPATGQQLRTVDELADLKGIFDFYIRKGDYFWKRTRVYIEMRADESLIKQGYAKPGDIVKLTATTTLSKYNEDLNLKAPANAQPWTNSSAPG
jgi:hypothetical protein